MEIILNMADNKAQGYGTIENEASDSRMEHLGKERVYMRDAILGVNDGLISTFLLVAGVSGSGLSSRNILLTSIAGALAGAVSMAAGEYVATKSQNEVMQGEIGLERAHIRDNKQDEIKEVAVLLETIGIPHESTELRNRLLSHYENNPEALLKLMIALEFGFVEDEQRKPITAAAASGALFFLGALPSVLPFMIAEILTVECLLIAAASTTVSLLVVGCVKTWATRGE